jgi:cobalt-zinc-cadmium efflux system outer membrane protein
MHLLDVQPAKDLQDSTADSLHDLAYAHRPDVLAQRKQVERAEAAIRSTRRQIVPDFALGLSYTQQGTGESAVSPPTLSADLTVTPPLFYRQEGELTMAEADLRTQRVTLDQTNAQVLSDVDTAFAAFGAARARRFRLEHGYLDQAKLARDLTKIQYEKGAATLLDLLVAQRAYQVTLQEYIQSLNDFWTAVFQLEAATGTEFGS